MVSVFRNVSVYLPDSFIESLDLLVRRGYYKSRGEAIRLAIRDLLLEMHSDVWREIVMRRNRCEVEA